MRKQNIRPKDDVSYKMATDAICMWMPSCNKQTRLELKNCTIRAAILLHFSTARKIGTNTKPIIQSLPLFPQLGANSAISIGYNPVYMPPTKNFFLCTSFALQIKQTPILAGAIILDTMKTPTHMLGCLEASRKRIPAALDL